MDCIKTTFIVLVAIFLASCSKDPKIIELPLSNKTGYGPFEYSYRFIRTFSNDENASALKTNIKVKGTPENWINTEFGDIEIVYYEETIPNLKNKVAFALGKDPSGVIKMILDANNNRDFSDDKQFKPLVYDHKDGLNVDSIALIHSIKVSFELFIDKKIIKQNAPMLVIYDKNFKKFLCDFPQYATTKLDGVEIAVCHDDFISFNYETTSIAVLNYSLPKGRPYGGENISTLNEYIEIGGKIFKNKGIKDDGNTLILEKMDLPKNQLHSTQIGYQSIPFKGENFLTKSTILSENLKGKYVYLDFWASFCKPCMEEFPNLNELYSKIDTSKIEFIGIVCETPASKLEKLKKELAINWPQILSDDSNRISEKYSVAGYPTSLLLNPEGVVIAKDLRGKKLVAKLERFLNEKRGQ
jgi:thiol-disulfide isomerase/thioredoxin